MHVHVVSSPALNGRNELGVAQTLSPPGLAGFGLSLPLRCRRVEPKQALFRAGQSMHALYQVHAGQFKTSVLSHDGREKITGFRMRGDLLGLDALGNDSHGCDVVALELCQVWELPCSLIDAVGAQQPELQRQLIAASALEIRRNWQWMLALATLSAEQRVAAFLVDLAERQRALGYSALQLQLRMSRAELGNFLALQLETVTRALSNLARLGIIAVQRRGVELLDPDSLAAVAGGARTCH